MAFPRPGRALKGLLLAIGGLGIATAVLVNYVPGGERVFLALACSTDAVTHGQVWRLFTAGLLTSPESLGHLVFVLLGLYFLSPDLEQRWGAARFLRFFFTSLVVGFLLSIAVDMVAPPSAPAGFHPRLMYGASAAIAAISVAWSRIHAQLRVNLFFFLPVTGKQLFWVTIGFCALGLIYPASMPEGVAAPFGGVITGLLLGGTPSVARSLYLRVKLALLRRRATSVSRGGETPLTPRSSATKKSEGPPLRVVQGGLEDELRKRRPPKDKRFLN